MVTIGRLLVLASGLLWGGLLLPAIASGEEPVGHVLILNSYHAGFDWSEGVLEAIRETFDAAEVPVEITAEFMDTKRHDPEAISDALAALYRTKHAQQRYDVLICVDNNALAFALERRDELFPGTPIVFCGINSFGDDMLDGCTGVTGVTEDIDVMGTLRLAQRLHPDLDGVAVVSDITPTSRLNLSRTQQAADSLGMRLTVLGGLRRDALIGMLEDLSPRTVVLYLDFYRTPSGERFTLQQGLSTLNVRSDLPVYSLWEDKVASGASEGMVGGVIATAQAQGHHAARMAQRVLRGEDADTIPIQRTCPTETVIRQPAVKRFGIAKAALPPGTVLLDRPASFAERHPEVVFVLAGALGIAALLLIVSYAHGRKRDHLLERVVRAKTELERAEDALRKSEERYRLITESSAEDLWQLDRDGRVTYTSPAVTRLFGYTQEEATQLDFGAFIIESDLERATEAFQKTIAGEPHQIIELTGRRKDGSTIPIEVSVCPIRRRDAIIGVQGIARDITERKVAEEALKASEESLTALIENSDGSIWSVDRDLRLVVGNSTFRDSIRAVLGRPFESGESVIPDGFPKDAIEQWRGYYERALRGERFTIEIPRRFRSAPRSFMECRFHPIRDEEGGITGVTVFGRDITERRKAEQDLRDSEERNRLLFDHAGLGIGYYDLSGRCLRMNRKACEAMGAREEEVLGRGAVDLFGEAMGKSMLDRIGLVSGDGRNRTFEDLIEIGGERRWFVSTYARIEGGSREATGVQIISEDVTARQRAQEERKRLMLAIEQVAEAVVVTDVEASIQYVNPAFEQITGYDRQEVLSQNPRILQSGEHDAAFYERMWTTLLAQKPWTGTMRNRKRDGTIYTEQAIISPVRDSTGNTVNYVAVKRDISEQMHLEEQLRQAQKMESIGRLAGGVAHDFNNMLLVILGHAELALTHEELPPAIREDLEEIQKAASRSADLTRQLLAFGRRQAIRPVPLDLNEAVSGLLGMLRRLLGEKVELIWEAGEGLWPVRVDPTQVDQVLANLCVNARDAIEDHGRITIRTENVRMTEAQADQTADPHAVPGDYVCLTVSDDGAGMDEQTRAQIFEPFFTTKNLGEGTGLGLATVFGIVAQHKGFIQVNSEPGRGTTFQIYLPRHSPLADEGFQTVERQVDHLFGDAERLP